MFEMLRVLLPSLLLPPDPGAGPGHSSAPYLSPLYTGNAGRVDGIARGVLATRLQAVSAT